MGRPCMHGKGKFTWKDGKVFEGQFEFLCPVEGTFTESDGSIFQVKYDKNTRIEPNPQLVHSRMKPRQRILALDPRLPPNERNYHLLEADSRSALTRIEDELAGFLRQQKIITDIENATRATTDPCVLPPDVLAEWTQDFSPARRIGSGSLGDVFEAHCPRVGRGGLDASSTAFGLSTSTADLRVAGPHLHTELVIVRSSSMDRLS